VEFAFDFLVGSDFQDFLFVGHDNRNAEGFSRLAVQEDFVDEIALCVQVLHFLSGDVLALLKFEDILFTINNLQAFCVCQQLPDVSSPEPSVFTDCLFGLFSVFVVSQKDAVSSDPDLSSWRRSVFLILVCT
jgi:hypothetical protein